MSEPLTKDNEDEINEAHILVDEARDILSDLMFHGSEMEAEDATGKLDLAVSHLTEALDMLHEIAGKR